MNPAEACIHHYDDVDYCACLSDRFHVHCHVDLIPPPLPRQPSPAPPPPYPVFRPPETAPAFETAALIPLPPLPMPTTPVPFPHSSPPSPSPPPLLPLSPISFIPYDNHARNYIILLLIGMGTLLAILIMMFLLTYRIVNRLRETTARLEISRMANRTIIEQQRSANEIPMVSLVIDPNGTCTSLCE